MAMDNLYDDDILDTAIVGPADDFPGACHVPFCDCGLEPVPARVAAERRAIDKKLTTK